MNQNGEKYIYYRPDCKECTKKRSTKWRENNSERFKELRKKCEDKPKSRTLKRKRNERLRQKGKVKLWQRNNPGKIREYNKYRELHKSHDIIEREWDACKLYFDNSCAYCGITEEEAKKAQGHLLHKEHVDHEGANDLSNCVPSCKSCNSRKWKYALEEWYTEDNDYYEYYSLDRLNKIYKWLKEDYKKYIVEEITI